MDSLKIGFPQISFAKDVKQRIDAYTDIAKGEYSLMGEVEEVHDRKGLLTHLRVVKVHLIEQMNTDASTELDDQGLAKLVLAMEEEEEGSSVRLRAWIHSHASMQTFWSETDKATIRSLLKSSEAYLISLVVNKHGSSLCRLDTYKPVPVTIDGIKPAYDAETNPYVDECKEEYKKKCKEVKILQTSSKHIGYKGDNDDYDREWYTKHGHNYSRHGKGNSLPSKWYPGQNPVDVADYLAKGKANKKKDEEKTGDTAESTPKLTIKGKTFDPGFDYHDANDLVEQFPQIDEVDAMMLSTGWHHSFIDDTDYDQIVAKLIENKDLSDVMDKNLYEKLEELYINSLGTNNDLSAVLGQESDYTDADVTPSSPDSSVTTTSKSSTLVSDDDDPYSTLYPNG